MRLGRRGSISPVHDARRLADQHLSIDKRASGGTSALHKSAARGGKSATADSGTAYIEINVTPRFI